MGDGHIVLSTGKCKGLLLMVQGVEIRETFGDKLEEATVKIQAREEFQTLKGFITFQVVESLLSDDVEKSFVEATSEFNKVKSIAVSIGASKEIDEGIEFLLTITCVRTEELNVDLFRKYRKPCAKLLRILKRVKSSIHCVVSVNGCTLIPKVQQIFQDLLKSIVLRRSMNFDEAIVYGETVQNMIITDDSNDILNVFAKDNSTEKKHKILSNNSQDRVRNFHIEDKVVLYGGCKGNVGNHTSLADFSSKDRCRSIVDRVEVMFGKLQRGKLKRMQKSQDGKRGKPPDLGEWIKYVLGKKSSKSSMEKGGEKQKSANKKEFVGKMIGANYKGEGSSIVVEDFFSMVLIKVCEFADACCVSTLRNMVFIFPTYASNSQNQATKDVVVIDDLNNLRSRDESTATNIVYGINKKAISAGVKNMSLV